MHTLPDYAALFDASPYPYLLVDPDLMIIGANQAYLKATGRTADIIGQPIFQAFPADPSDPDSTNVAQVAASIGCALRTGLPHTVAFLRYAIPHQTPAGTVFEERFWSAVHTPVMNADGAVAFVTQNAIDVTDLYTFDRAAGVARVDGRPCQVQQPADLDRVQMHEAMKRILNGERSHLSNLFDQAPGFIAVMSGDQHIFEMVNEAYYQLVGHRDIIGKAVFEALPELEGQGFRQLLDQVFSTGEAVVARSIKAQVQRVADGPLIDRYIDLVYQPLFSGDGKVSGIFTQGHDVTDCHDARYALREADRRKDEFLAMLAHELRNPLAPISAAAQLLKMPTLKPELVKKTSEIIGRQVGHMTSLIDDLLDVSRVTRGLVVLERKRLGIAVAVTDAVEQVRPMINARHQDLSVRLPADAIEVLGDQKRLVQVLTNLLNNAAKYTPEGGTLGLIVEATATQVAVCIRDNGIGIPADLLPHVFDLFTQAERAPDRSQGGLGLGLALVRSLVALHGGSVVATSGGRGQGAAFTVRLPRIVDAPQRDGWKSAQTALPRRDKRLRLLVVDDNADAAEMLGAFMESVGHEVIIEHEPYLAIERVRAAPPDACLLDIGLPGMDGNQLARQLRSMPEMSAATLIAVTGYGKKFDRETSIAAGFDYYFVKPADPVTLIALLDRIHVS